MHSPSKKMQRRARRSLWLHYVKRTPAALHTVPQVCSDAEAHAKSDAVLRIARLLAWPLPALAALARAVPRCVRDWTYDLVARHRRALLPL